MTRFNIVLLPTDTRIQNLFVDLSQKHFGAVANGYVLGANALAHVTLCQFRAVDNRAARDAFWAWGGKRNGDLRLTRFHFREGDAEHAGMMWAEILVEKSRLLLEQQRECFEHLAQLDFETLTPVETYSPHVTLARMAADAIPAEPTLQYALDAGAIAVRPAVGLSTENGVFAKEL